MTIARSLPDGRWPPRAPVKCPGCAERARSAPLAVPERASARLILALDS
jgi:hypothetical protein